LLNRIIASRLRPAKPRGMGKIRARRQCSAAPTGGSLLRSYITQIPCRSDNQPSECLLPVVDRQEREAMGAREWDDMALSWRPERTISACGLLSLQMPHAGQSACVCSRSVRSSPPVSGMSRLQWHPPIPGATNGACSRLTPRKRRSLTNQIGHSPADQNRANRHRRGCRTRRLR